MTVKKLIIDAKKYGSRKAIYDDKRSIAFDGLEQEIIRFFNFLSPNILTHQYKFGVFLDNRVEYMLAYLTAFYTGNPIVPVNTGLAAAEIEYIIKDSEISMLLVDHKSFPKVREICDRCRIPLVNIDDYYNEIPFMAQRGNDITPDTIASINYTSGTTGHPKGVMLSQKNHLTSCRNFLNAVRDLGSARHILHVLPFSHSTVSLLLPAIMQGITSGIRHCPTPLQALEAIRDLQPDTLLLYPAYIIDMVDLIKKDPGLRDSTKSLRTLCYGSSPISTEKLKESLELMGNIFVQAYGMTETLPPLTCLGKEDHQKGLSDHADSLLSSCGRIVEGVQVRILDDHDRELPEGEIGEVVCRGDNVTAGYYRNQEATDGFIRDGWAHTGDLGYVKNNYLFLVERKKDLVNRRSQKVFSAEVEKAVLALPGVVECAVFSVPDVSDGEIPYCAVVFEKERDVRDLRGELVPKLAEFKIPVGFLVMEKLPRNINGKVDKKTLKAPYWVNVERNIN